MGGVSLSFGAKTAVSAMRAIKKSGLVKGPDADLEVALKRAREYNQMHPYKEPTDRKAVYETRWVDGYPCLVIRPEKPARKAILFLHGGGDHDAWKPEVSFARRYGKRAGMDVFYPIYPPFTEAPPAQTADLIFDVYRSMVKEYGAKKVAVVGGSYGGLLAMQLLTCINRNPAQAKMPGLLISEFPLRLSENGSRMEAGGGAGTGRRDDHARRLPGDAGAHAETVAGYTGLPFAS